MCVLYVDPFLENGLNFSNVEMLITTGLINELLTVTATKRLQPSRKRHNVLFVLISQEQRYEPRICRGSALQT